jgi:hypothetical protein
MTAAMILAGRMATSLWYGMTLWVYSLSVACGGHGMAPGERHANAGKDSTRSRSSIETSTPPERPGDFRNSL